MALYWNPVPLAPGESRTYTTLYGIGGVSLSPAQLALGLTAPAEVDYQYEDTRSFALVCYLENSGGYEARSAKCTLTLPKGLKLEQGDLVSSLGSVKPGETRQLAWRVLPTGEAEGPLQLTVAVTSENLEPNQVTREVIVNSPPQLELKLEAPIELAVTPENRYSPNPFVIRATATNRGAQIGRNVVAALELPNGLKLSEGAGLQMAERLGPKESRTFTWSAVATGFPTGDLPVTVSATAAGAKAAQAGQTVTVPLLTPELRVYPAEQTVPLKNEDGEPTLVPIDIVLAPARDFVGVKVSLRYDPAVLEPLYVRRGEAFVDEGRLLAPWSVGHAGKGLLADIGGQRTDAPALNVPEVQICRVIFIARGTGETELALESSTMTGSKGRTIEHRLVAGKVTVKALEESK